MGEGKTPSAKRLRVTPRPRSGASRSTPFGRPRGLLGREAALRREAIPGGAPTAPGQPDGAERPPPPARVLPKRPSLGTRDPRPRRSRGPGLFGVTHPTPDRQSGSARPARKFHLHRRPQAPPRPGLVMGRHTQVLSAALHATHAAGSHWRASRTCGPLSRSYGRGADQ